MYVIHNITLIEFNIIILKLFWKGKHKTWLKLLILKIDKILSNTIENYDKKQKIWNPELKKNIFHNFFFDFVILKSILSSATFIHFNITFYYLQVLDVPMYNLEFKNIRSFLSSHFLSFFFKIFRFLQCCS